LHCPRPYLSVSFSDAPLTLHSFPTRRSSDLIPGQTAQSFATDGIQQTLLDQVGGHLLQRLFRQHQGAELTHVTRHHHPPLVIPEGLFPFFYVRSQVLLQIRQIHRRRQIDRRLPCLAV